MIACERRKLSRYLLGELDVERMTASMRAKLKDKRRKASFKAQRRQAAAGSGGDAALVANDVEMFLKYFGKNLTGFCSLVEDEEINNVCVAEKQNQTATTNDNVPNDNDEAPFDDVDWIEPAPAWSVRRDASSFGFADLDVGARRLRFRFWHVDSERAVDELVIEK